jgi:hypothetical protein
MFGKPYPHTIENGNMIVSGPELFYTPRMPITTPLGQVFNVYNNRPLEEIQITLTALFLMV